MNFDDSMFWRALSNLRDNLSEGKFIYLIAVDEMNPILQQTINFMDDHCDIYSAG